MGEKRPESIWIDWLKPLMAVSLFGAVVMLVVAVAMRSFGHLRAQVLLTFVGVAVGALLLQVQLRAVKQWRSGRWSKLLTLGVAVIAVSQVSFGLWVWTELRTSSIVWRIWWVSMVPSIFVTHLLLLRSAGEGQSHPLARVTRVCIVWAGLMILWLGLRADMLADIPAWYLWLGALPAGGTIIGPVAMAIHSTLDGREVGRRGLVAAVLMSHLVAGVGAFFIGRATAGHGRRLDHGATSLLKTVPQHVGGQFGRDYYATQAGVAEFLGDTRVVRRPPFITYEQIEGIEARLKPGDILLERRNWYLSNPFLPGFWPHAALYVGRMEDLQRLGIAQDPAVVKHRAVYLAKAPDGRDHTVIEAISEGVLLNSLTHSMHADHVAVLRPRLTDKQIAAAIVRAFGYLGREYDFNFDFEDTDRLVCTQVIYESYRGALDFPLKRVMGRWTLPAVEVARAFARADRQMDFVLFLDGDTDKGIARERDADAFIRSLDRPRAFVEE